MSGPHDLWQKGSAMPLHRGRDLAPLIAAHLVEARIMPCGPYRAYWLAAWIWPEATADETYRGYEIAIELWEDEYLFAQQA